MERQFPSEYLFDLANVYSRLGDCYDKIGNYSEAEKSINSAIDYLNRDLKRRESIPAKCNLGVAYKQLARIKRFLGNYEASKKLLLEAIKIHEALVEKNPYAYSIYLAKDYHSFSQFLSDQSKYIEAEEYIIKSLNILVVCNI